MQKILTITFSPSVDKSTSVPKLVPEKKLRCSAPVLDPGGGGINVARVIRRLGGEVLAVYPAGGHNGKAFNELLSGEKVPARVIEAVQETRENIVVLEVETNQQYRFGMPGTPLAEQEWREILSAAGEAGAGYIVASGSLPPGVPLDIYARLAGIARGSGARLVVDTSGEALKAVAREGVFMLKPNIGELASLAGKEWIEESDIESTARSVIESGAAELLVVSLGAGGAMLLTAKETYKVQAPPAPRRSVVGAGDSMVAGIVLSLALGKGYEEALKYGVACGTAATMNEGTGLCRVEDVEMLMRAM